MAVGTVLCLMNGCRLALIVADKLQQHGIFKTSGEESGSAGNEQNETDPLLGGSGNGSVQNV